MRRCIRAGLLMAMVFAARPAFADPIAVGDKIHVLGSDGTIWGGAFSVDNLANGDGVDFMSFCVQLEEDIDYDTIFQVGGISDFADDVAGNDPIDPETAWIFSGYRHGALGAFSSDEIQAAIWILEGEWLTNVGNSAALLDLAHAAVLGGWVNTNVEVLNVFYLDGAHAQDQLTLSEVPEPGTLMLVGGGAAALLRRRRNRNRAC